MNQSELKYFRDNWKPDYDKFIHSGWKLLEKFSIQKVNRVQMSEERQKQLILASYMEYQLMD